MRVRFALLAVLLCGVGNAYSACRSDYDCGYGNRCVKPRDGIGLTGICVTPTDQFGNRTFSVPPPSSQPHKVEQCSFDTQCGIGYSCVKQGNQIYGICVK